LIYVHRLNESNNVMREPVRISNPMYNADYRMTELQRQQQLQHLSSEGKWLNINVWRPDE